MSTFQQYELALHSMAQAIQLHMHPLDIAVRCDVLGELARQFGHSEPSPVCTETAHLGRSEWPAVSPLDVMQPLIEQVENL